MESFSSWIIFFMIRGITVLYFVIQNVTHKVFFLEQFHLYYNVTESSTGFLSRWNVTKTVKIDNSNAETLIWQINLDYDSESIGIRE